MNSLNYMFENINELSVLVSALVVAAIGSIWYSPLFFGIPWMKATGLSFENKEIPLKPMVAAIAKGVVAHTLFFFIIAQFVSISRDAAISLLTIGILLSALFGAQLLGPVIWEKKPLSYFFIQAGYVTLSIFVGLGIIAYWPW